MWTTISKADTWTPIDPVGSPEARARHTAIWTGEEMAVSAKVDSLVTGDRHLLDLGSVGGVEIVCVQHPE